LQNLNSSLKHKEHLKNLALTMIKRKWTESIFFFRPRSEGAGKASAPVEVFDYQTDKTTIYASVTDKNKNRYFYF